MYTFGCIYLGDGQTKKVNKPRVFVVLDLFRNLFKRVFSFFTSAHVRRAFVNYLTSHK